MLVGFATHERCEMEYKCETRQVSGEFLPGTDEVIGALLSG